MAATDKDRQGENNIPGLMFAAKPQGVYEYWEFNIVDYMKNGLDSTTKFFSRGEKMSDPKHSFWATLTEDWAKAGILHQES